MGGLVSIRQRNVHVENIIDDEIKRRRIVGNTYKYFTRGNSAQATDNDFVVDHRRKAVLQPYDKLLKAFKYKDCLDAALGTNNSNVVVSLLQELILRGTLQIALSGRDEDTLEPLLRFMVKYICVPKYSTILIDVCQVIFDLYTTVLGQSITIDELFFQIKNQVEREINV